MKKRNNNEHKEQKAFFDWVNVAKATTPELSLFFAIPNGGKRTSAIAGKILKDEGVKSGVPDVFLPVARNGYHGLFLEFKAPENKGLAKGNPSDNQRKYMEAVEKQQYKTHVVYGWDEAKLITLDYLNGGKTSSIINIIDTMTVNDALEDITHSLRVITKNVALQCGREEAKAIAYTISNKITEDANNFSEKPTLQ